MEAGATLRPARASSEADSATADPSPVPRGEYACAQCGHRLRVFGGGRHRVYFPVENAPLDDPVMDGRCPECGTGLPGKQ